MTLTRTILIPDPTPEDEAERRAYDVALDVAQVVYDLREEMGLDQAAFAERVGLTTADIDDLEDADHRDPVPTLRHIAEALGRRLELRVVPMELKSEAPAEPEMLAEAAAA